MQSGSQSKKARPNSASNSPAPSAASSTLNVNSDSIGFNPVNSSSLSSSGLTSPRELTAAAPLSVNNLASGATTPNLNSHLSSMSLGNANQGLGLNLGLLGSGLDGLSSFSGLTGLNPNLCNLSNLSNPNLAATVSGLQQPIASSITSPSSPTTRSSSSTNPQAIIVDDEDDEQDDRNSFQSESPSDQRQSSASKPTGASSLRSLQTSSQRLSTGSTGSSASIQSLGQPQQATPPSLSLLEHSLINSHGAAHLPHSLHPAHPLSHQSAALLGLHHQSGLQPPHSESTANSINSCATSSGSSQTISAPTPVSQGSSSSHPHSTNTSSNQLHHPYNLSALTSFPNLSSLNNLNNLNSLNSFPYGSLAAAHHHASSLTGAGSASGQSSQASTIHHHPFFGSSHPSSNFGSLISEHAPNFGLHLPISSSGSTASSLSNSRRSSDTALQLDSLANKNFLSAAGLNAMSNSSLNQRTQHSLQLLQQLHQSHMQQLQQQRLGSRTGQQHTSRDSGMEDSEDHLEANEFAGALHRVQAVNNHTLKGKEKTSISKENEHSEQQKSKNKRDLEQPTKQLTNKSGKQQNGHCNNSKLDYHDERDDEDDYSNYNKKKIFIFSGSKQRRHYQSGSGSSNNTSSSGGGGGNSENSRKCTFGNLECFGEEEQEQEQDSLNEQDDAYDIINYSDLEDGEEPKHDHEMLGACLINKRLDSQRKDDLRFSPCSPPITEDEDVNRSNKDLARQNSTRENELNSSINSVYSSTGSVMSCCGTTLIDVNSSTNENGRSASQAKLQDIGLEDISSDDGELVVLQDTVLQKQADSTNSIVVSKHRKSSNTSPSSMPPVFNERNQETNRAIGERKPRSRKNKVPIDELATSVGELGAQLNRPGNEHLAEYLILAFLRDNHGKADRCMAKLEQGEHLDFLNPKLDENLIMRLSIFSHLVYNEAIAQQSDTSRICDQFVVKNRSVLSRPPPNSHSRRGDDGLSLADKQPLSSIKTFGELRAAARCNENNKNESNIISPNSSTNSSITNFYAG